MKYFLYCRKSTEDEERQVLSLPSQRETLDRAFGDNREIEIVESFEESKSAKTPGRPLFAEMMRRIEAGEAQGILSWAPDRLARNSIDGGHVIYLLDTGTLRDLKFSTYTFENNSQGKFMLSIMFGQSKYYSDALSDNVKRGNRTKLERGWRPNRAPLGYLNDKATRTIVPDPDRFPLLRRMFEMVLAETHIPRQIVRIARDEWGFLTPKLKKCGGTPLAASTIYKLLSNPFYAGVIEWNGAIYPGSHMPIVSRAEFERVQVVLNRRSAPHSTRMQFPYTGLMRCGSCNRMITAERKVNRFGSRYTYYHCSARSVARGGCGEPSIEATHLNALFREFLSSLHVCEEIADWVRTELAGSRSFDAVQRRREAETRERAIDEMRKQIDELTSLRLRRLIDDEEYVDRRNQLHSDRLSLESAIERPDPCTLIEPFDLLVSASNKAVQWFDSADDDGKRTLIKITGSNPRLGGKLLNIQAAKPFFHVRYSDGFPRLRGDVDVVRTSPLTPKRARSIAREGRRFVKAFKEYAEHPVAQEGLDELKGLVRRFAPELVPQAPKAASRRRVRAKPRLMLLPETASHCDCACRHR